MRSLISRRMLHEAAIAMAAFLAVALNSCGPSKEAAVAPPAAEKKPLMATFKILSVNARHTLKGKGDVRRLAKVIKSTAADIVAVQEIERPQEGSSDFDAVQELAKQTEMYDYFGKARYFEGFDSGNALFSTYPVSQTAVQELPVEDGKVRRSLAFGVIDVGLKEVGVSSTELDENSPSQRVKEAVQITSIARSVQRCSVHRLRILLGADHRESGFEDAGTVRRRKFSAGLDAENRTTGVRHERSKDPTHRGRESEVRQFGRCGSRHHAGNTVVSGRQKIQSKRHAELTEFSENQISEARTNIPKQPGTNRSKC